MLMCYIFNIGLSIYNWLKIDDYIVGWVTSHNVFDSRLTIPEYIEVWRTNN